jgi:predicted kinase
VNQEIRILSNTLLVLCGPSGSGKSTFAARHFKPTQVVASDRCRALLCDSEHSRKINKETFDLFHYIIQKRLVLGRLTVADSTALYSFARRPLLDLAQQAGYHTCLLVFDVPLDICLERDAGREHRIGMDGISYQYDLFLEAMAVIRNEPWEQQYILGPDTSPIQVKIVRTTRQAVKMAEGEV